jgi:hypothetical protein
MSVVEDAKVWTSTMSKHIYFIYKEKVRPLIKQRKPTYTKSGNKYAQAKKADLYWKSKKIENLS